MNTYFPETTDKGEALRESKTLTLLIRDATSIKYSHSGHYNKGGYSGFFFLDLGSKIDHLVDSKQRSVTPISPIDIKELLELSDFEYRIMLDSHKNQLNLIKGVGE